MRPWNFQKRWLFIKRFERSNKRTDWRPSRKRNYELQQLLSDALVPTGVDDIFKLAGLESPDISVLSKSSTVSKMPLKNLAVELHNDSIKDQVKTKFRTNVVKEKKYSDRLMRL